MSQLGCRLAVILNLWFMKVVSNTQITVNIHQAENDFDLQERCSPDMPIQLDRLRSTLPTASLALPADVVVNSTPFQLPKLTPRGTSSKAKRNSKILKLLGKPKPQWKRLKNKFTGNSTADNEEGASNDHSGKDDKGGQMENEDEGSGLETYHSMMPELLCQGHDLHVQVSKAMSAREGLFAD